MIIHSPIVSGSLTFADGSTFTLPDGGNFSGSFSGSVQISEVLSHLVPNANEVYDLGSSTNRFRDLYLSNNTIDFPSGSLGFGNNGFGFSDPFGAPAPIVTSEVKVLDESDGSFAKLSVVGGTLTTTAFDPFGNESAFDMKSQLSGSFTGSFLGEILATNGVVSGSSQVVIGSVDGFTAHSASVDGRILTEKGRVDAILASADADKDSFAEIVTLINSVDTTNDNAFASFYTASNDRFDNIEGFTSSIDTTIKTKMDADSVVSGSSQLVSLLPSGVISSSAQVNADSITNFDSNVKDKLTLDGVISSSVQVDVLQTTNFAEFSSSVADTFGGLSTDYNDLQNIPSGIISSSEQLAADFLDTLGDNVVSSSAQIDLTQTTNYASGIKLKLDAENVFTGSSQVTISDTTGFSEFSSSVSTTFDGLSSNYVDLVGIPSGIISSSDQLDGESISFGNITGSDILSSGNVSAHGYITSEDGLYVTLPGAQTMFSVTQAGDTVVRGTLEIGSSVNGITDVSASIASNVASIASHVGRSDNPHSVTAAHVGLENVTNESKTTMFSSPTFTGTVSGVTKTHVGLGFVDNTSDADKPISTATQTALDLKLDASHDLDITLTGDVTGTATITNMGDVTITTTVGDDSHNHTIANVDGLQAALDSKQSGGSYVTTTSAQSLSSAANALTFAANTLTLTRGDGSTDTVNLSAYLDDTNLARVISGTYNAGTTSLVFTRDDASTFSIDASMFFDDTNLVTSVAGNAGAVTATELLNAIKTVDGAGSGLDADLIDGLSSASFIRSDANDTASGIITLSNSTASTTKTTGALVVTGGVGISGALNVGGDVVAYASSDRRLKDNIVNIENPIEKVQKLNGVTWDWNGNADELQQSLPNVGVIAQEVEEVFPQLVHDRENGYKGVDYAKLTGLLIEAVKEQQKQIDELKSRLG